MSEATRKSVLSVRNAGIHYKRNRGIFGEPVWAFKDISFEVYQGETLGIIGRNGVGKSTLLRMMAGILKPDTGSFINHDKQSVSLLAMQLGFVPHLSGRENALLSGMLMGLSKRQMQEKMEAVIKFSELGEYIERPIATYSSGMLARLGFSVAFQVDPDILLIDEIIGVGDAEFSQKSAAVMCEKTRSHKTVVFVSHQEILMKQLCDRCIWIENGVSRMQGTPDEVFEQYHVHYAQTHAAQAQ